MSSEFRPLAQDEIDALPVGTRVYLILLPENYEGPIEGREPCKRCESGPHPFVIIAGIKIILGHRESKIFRAV